METQKTKRLFKLGGLVAPLLIMLLIFNLFYGNEYIILTLADQQSGPGSQYASIANITIKYLTKQNQIISVAITNPNVAINIPKDSIILEVNTTYIVAKSYAPDCNTAINNSMVILYFQDPGGTKYLPQDAGATYCLGTTPDLNNWVITYRTGTWSVTMNIVGKWILYAELDIYLS